MDWFFGPSDPNNFGDEPMFVMIAPAPLEDEIYGLSDGAKPRDDIDKGGEHACWH